MAVVGNDTRLNKFISETGIVSRREADRLIEDGAVKVNGRKAEMGMRVSSDDRITVRGKPLRAKPKAVYIAYNKPVGITCTTDPAIAGNIVDAVKYPQRIFPIGRLDKPSQGLILLTNDGDIVNKILRAGNAHEKEYRVSVDKPIGTDFVNRMAAGVPILGTVTRPCQVTQTGASSFTIVLTQGLNRQIRRMAEYLGYNVTHLKRVRLMNISLGKLQVGQWRELSSAEMGVLDKMLAHSSKTEEASPSREKQSPRANKPTQRDSKSRDGSRGAAKPAHKKSAKPGATRGKPRPGKRMKPKRS